MPRKFRRRSRKRALLKRVGAWGVGESILLRMSCWSLIKDGTTQASLTVKASRQNNLFVPYVNPRGTFLAVRKDGLVMTI